MLAIALSLALGPPTLPHAPGVPDPVPETVVSPGAKRPEPGVPVPPADAVAAAVDLSWTAPSECAGTAQVRKGIAGLLGATTEQAAAAQVHVVATITRAGVGYRLALRVETPSGRTSKTLDASACGVLVDATALISAITIDPSAVLQEVGEEAEPEPPEPEVPAIDADPTATGDDGQAPPTGTRPSGSARGNVRVDDSKPPGEVKDPSRVPLLRFALRATGGLDVATLPGVSGGVGVSGAILGARWRVELTGLSLFPRTGFAADRAGARIGLLALGARGCWVPTIGAFELPLCGGGEAGRLRGDPAGDRIVNASEVSQAHVAAIASAGFAWAPRPFVALVARAELVVPLLRPSFVIGDALAHQLPPASGRIFAGIEARFP